jgi:predicted Zn-dependent peptidase
LPPGPNAAKDSVPATHARIALRNKKALEQVHLCLGVPSYPLPHEKRFACYVLNTLLGGGMSSRLFQNIRERQGLAYAVFLRTEPLPRHRLPDRSTRARRSNRRAKWWSRSSRNSAT